MTARERERGVTLLEILVVIILLAILLGLSVVVFRSAGQDAGAEAAFQAVVAILRSAPQDARADGMPVRVVFDRSVGTVRAMSREAVQVWTLETDPPEGDGAIAPGRLGNGWRVDPRGAEIGRIDFLDASSGFFVEVWVRPDAGAGADLRILEAGDARISLDGRLRVEAALGEATLTSPTPIPSEVWTLIAVTVMPDGEAAMYIGGREVAREAGVSFAPPTEEPLEIGGGRGEFSGVIDEVIVGQIFTREPVRLPGTSRMEFPDRDASVATLVVEFGPDGRRVPMADGGEAVVRFVLPAATRELAVQPDGMTERREVEAGE